MTTRLPPQCLACAHWQSPFDRGDMTEEPTQLCTAFPKGIPYRIWWNKADHRQPYQGDNGIRWQPMDSDTQFPEYALNT